MTLFILLQWHYTFISKASPLCSRQLHVKRVANLAVGLACNAVNLAHISWSQVQDAHPVAHQALLGRQDHVTDKVGVKLTQAKVEIVFALDMDSAEVARTSHV